MATWRYDIDWRVLYKSVCLVRSLRTALCAWQHIVDLPSCIWFETVCFAGTPWHLSVALLHRLPWPFRRRRFQRLVIMLSTLCCYCTLSCNLVVCLKMNLLLFSMYERRCRYVELPKHSWELTKLVRILYHQFGALIRGWRCLYTIQWSVTPWSITSTFQWQPRFWIK